MLPDRITKQIEVAVEAFYNNPGMPQYLNTYLKSIEDNLYAETIYNNSVCTYCSESMLLVDLVVPEDFFAEDENKKTSWNAVIKIGYRCNKLLERFDLRHWYIGNGSTRLPGHSVRRISCPYRSDDPKEG